MLSHHQWVYSPFFVAKKKDGVSFGKVGNKEVLPN